VLRTGWVSPPPVFWIFMEQGKIMEAEVPTVRVGANPTGLMMPPPPQPPKVFYRPDILPSPSQEHFKNSPVKSVHCDRLKLFSLQLVCTAMSCEMGDFTSRELHILHKLYKSPCRLLPLLFLLLLSCSRLISSFITQLYHTLTWHKLCMKKL